MTHLINSDFSSQHIMLIGIGFLLGGLIGLIAIKAHLIPNLPIKRKIIIVGFVVGVVLIGVGFFTR